ncbi:MAG: single-stranded DNA-binding protein, partial [Methanobrevibacter sp.]|nr:single-stranded DNA-binding protein [Methanobrevibacter sp.]
DRKVVRNSIAVRRDFKNKDGEYDTDFFDFSVWGSQAEFIEKYAKKGDKISIIGKLQNNNYEDEQGVHYRNVIQVENIEILTSRNSDKSDVISSIEDVAKEVFDKAIIEEEKAKEISIDDLLE